jgi:hypothetical protein
MFNKVNAMYEFFTPVFDAVTSDEVRLFPTKESAEAYSRDLIARIGVLVAIMMIIPPSVFLVVACTIHYKYKRDGKL